MTTQERYEIEDEAWEQGYGCGIYGGFILGVIVTLLSLIVYLYV